MAQEGPLSLMKKKGKERKKKTFKKQIETLGKCPERKKS